MKMRGRFLLKVFRNSCSNIMHTRHFQSSGRPPRCDAHMNELPIPCAPWDPWYKEKQDFYNKVLVGGILWWVFSFAMMLYTNSLYLNWGPPSQPGPPSDMVDECEDVD